MKKKDQNTCILNFKSDDVKNFFLKSKNYFTLDIPDYFVFDILLETLSKKLSEPTYEKKEDLYNDLYTKDFRNQNDVNYILYNNKDGKYAWRRMQIIHPLIYVALVHKITKEDNWELIKEKFKEFKENKQIECTIVKHIELGD